MVSTKSYYAVSNRDMQRTIPAWSLLLLAVGLWGQTSSANQPEKVAIQRVKNLMVSSLDPLLPNVTLEFFLKTEGEGSPIQWAVNDCGGRMEKSTVNSKPDSPKCVSAVIGFKDLRSLAVLVSIGTFKEGVIGIPTVFGVTITGQGGSRPVRRLSDLPMELHRRLLPNLPRDVPFPVDAPS
jgi:hypothetical protein